MTTDRGRFPYPDFFQEMISMNRLKSSVAALAMSLFVWGCDNAGMTQPELAPSAVVVTSTSGRRFQVVAEKDKRAESVSAQIGRQGGVLTLGRHSLYVSPGAVKQPTKFTITRDAADALRVKLTAGRQSENDVGAEGFDAPVYLVLSYAQAEDVPRDRSTIKMVYFRPDGLVEELETDVQVWGKYAGAELPHFSLFGLAWPR